MPHDHSGELAKATGRSPYWALGALDEAESRGVLVRVGNGGFNLTARRRKMVWVSLATEQHAEFIKRGGAEWLRGELSTTR